MYSKTLYTTLLTAIASNYVFLQFVHCFTITKQLTLVNRLGLFLRAKLSKYLGRILANFATSMVLLLLLEILKLNICLGWQLSKEMLQNNMKF